MTNEPCKHPNGSDEIVRTYSHPTIKTSLSNPSLSRHAVHPIEPRVFLRRHTASESSADSNRGSSQRIDWRKHYHGLEGGASKNKHKRASKTFSAVSVSSRSEGNVKRWNVFRSVPRDRDSLDPRWTILLTQVFKVLVYVAMHLLVISSGVMAKSCLLILTSNLRSSLSFFSCEPIGPRQSFVPQAAKPVLPGSSAWIYWCLFLALCVPELLTFIRCFRFVFFRFIPTPSAHLFILPFIVETCHTIGVCLFVFVVLPSLDSVRGAMLTCATAAIPLLLSAIAQAGTDIPRRSLFVLADLLALCCQLTGLWLWPALDPNIASRRILPVSLLLISLGWWENFVTKSSTITFISWLGHVKERLQRSRYKIYIFVSVWKVALMFFCMVLAAGVNHRLTYLFDLNNPFERFNATTALTPKIELLRKEAAEYSWSIWILFLWLTFSSVVCYQVAKYACKVKMERFSYAIPVASIVPATIIICIAFCESRKHQACYFAGFIPDQLFFNCQYGDVVTGLLRDRLGWAWLLWFASYLWIVSHIFTQKPSRLSTTDTLFVLPMYSGLLVDQSLTLNRRRVNMLRIQAKDIAEDDDADNNSMVTEGTDFSAAYSMTSLSMAKSSADLMTKIYICGTVWHETPTEMLQMLKSILRMDEDQSARKNAQKYLKIVDPDYYELEAHIFFDDAWEYDEDVDAHIPNAFVRQFVNVIDDAASAVHSVNVKLRPPVKLDVPYGGRLVWTLPGDNRLFVHLKDKTKIRHKKRWSQVMYMYYLLGHRIMEMVSDVSRKQALADNTYILAIDGDSNFSPSSVQKLVDLMKKQQRLGSACGRIHPIGTGFMVWYQKFEYAIGHWFQKAAEHVFGCVLCAPGCFSLFRASALMDDNVMNKYTKLAEEPRHFVQYDQGEDRWLSTLLLKQGYRIEYAAAADADTYAPEGFDEFFNQRRRWTPSSLANTIDLLADYKRTVQNNDSISTLYIAYQMLVIVFSLLGPAIIFTMMVFAQAAAFRVGSWPILVANLTPIAVFVLVCFIASSKAQLMLAKMLGIVYAFVMMAVLVGTGIQIVTEGLESPISVFVVGLAGVFCVAAFLHPKEFTNIFYGAVFFLCIPCTYVILSLYALINLNVINWGTREAAAKVLGKVGETTIERWIRKVKARAKEQPGRGQASINGTSRMLSYDAREEGGRGLCGCDRFCRCLGCLPEDESARLSYRQDEQFIWMGTHLEHLDQKVDRLIGKFEDGPSARRLTLFGNASVPVVTEPTSDLLRRYSSGLSVAALMTQQVQPQQQPQIVDSASVNTAASSSSSQQPADAASFDQQRPLVPKIVLHSATPLGKSLSDSLGVTLNASALSCATLPPEMTPLDDAANAAGVRFHLPSGVEAPNLDGESPPFSGFETPSPYSSVESLIDVNPIRHHGRGENNIVTSTPPDSNTPKWMQLDYLAAGQNDILDEMENSFWVDMISEYLAPFRRTPDEEAAITQSLKELRNKIAFALLLINGLLVLVIYLLQINKELLSIQWNPSANYSIIKYTPETGRYDKVYEPLKIEPIGFTIIIFLSVILLVQTGGMIFHRLNTLSHVLASTVLPCFRKRRSDHYDGDELLEENAVEIAKNLQKLTDDDGNRSGKKRRRIIFDLEKGRQKKQRQRTKGLHHAFQKRFFSFSADRHKTSFKGVQLDKSAIYSSDSAKRAAADAIRKRRDSILRESNEKRVDKIVSMREKRKRNNSQPFSQTNENANFVPARLDYGESAEDGSATSLSHILNANSQNSVSSAPNSNVAPPPSQVPSPAFVVLDESYGRGNNPGDPAQSSANVPHTTKTVSFLNELEDIFMNDRSS